MVSNDLPTVDILLLGRRAMILTGVYQQSVVI